MYNNFLNLKEEKRNRIIDAAIKEFANKGYKNASTNEIVKSANISKGLLFHYFGSKKNLFLFLFDYCMELNYNHIFKIIDKNEKDIFIKIKQIAMAKLKLFKEYPDIFKFIEISYFEDSSEIKKEIEDRINSITQKSYGYLLTNIDSTSFKESLDIKIVLNIIFWTFEGYGNQEIKKQKLIKDYNIDYEKLIDEMDNYINIFKECFYKK